MLETNLDRMRPVLRLGRDLIGRLLDLPASRQEKLVEQHAGMDPPGLPDTR